MCTINISNKLVDDMSLSSYFRKCYDSDTIAQDGCCTENHIICNARHKEKLSTLSIFLRNIECKRQQSVCYFSQKNDDVMYIPEESTILSCIYILTLLHNNGFCLTNNSPREDECRNQIIEHICQKN